MSLFMKLTPKKAGYPGLVRMGRVDVVTRTEWEEEHTQHGVPVTVLVKGSMVFVRDSDHGLPVREDPDKIEKLLERGRSDLETVEEIEAEISRLKKILEEKSHNI